MYIHYYVNYSKNPKNYNSGEISMPPTTMNNDFSRETMMNRGCRFTRYSRH